MLKRFVATTAVALALALPATAQQSRSDDPVLRSQSDRAEREPNQNRMNDQKRMSEEADERPTNALTLADADSIQGSKVTNPQGERIGSIEDVVLDIKKGQVAYAIIGAGGFLGAGEHNVAVPWNQLKPTNEAQSFVLNVDKNTLQNAPAIERDKVARLEDQKVRRDIAAFWDKAGRQQAQMPDQGGRQRHNDSRQDR